ncbi:MAG TPA: polyamine aminopropyltransferase [Pyrodictium delaneyi]|uniref:Polyamine aminopropyltransferase n=1 Tax=Pyrodictium delaneyi TaxID=1273541 RepID=A0A832ZSQ3_9CREN|nr:polyamine aminopropyltransferase [Pyrodictium delaneyi]
MELDVFRLSLYQPGGPMGTIYAVEEVIYSTRSQYQDIIIARLKGFGKTLILDGLIQSTESDEYIYHEALVHPAMSVHPEPKRVLILGGGEGATLRDVLRHNTVEKAVMVDIDGEVVEVSKKFLPEWHQGAFEDPRAEVYIMDGFRFVREAAKRGEKFDVIMMDLTDPYGSDIAAQLYSREAFELITRVLEEDGIIVTQAGCSTLFPEAFQKVYNAMNQVFRFVREYVVWVPSFAYTNSFIAASNKHRIESIPMEEIDQRLEERSVKTKFYNGLRHIAMIGMAGVSLNAAQQ